MIAEQSAEQRAEQNLLQAEKIHITDFKILKEQIDCSFEFDESLIQSHQSKFGYEMSFDLELNLVKTDLRVEVVTESEVRQEEAKGMFHLAFICWVENLQELASFNAKTEEIHVHEELGNALASMTYATSRGILMMRLQGTELRQFTLPVISIEELLN